MRYAFVVNPASGQGKHEDGMVAAIEALIEEREEDIRLYYTCGEKDATVLADAIAADAGDERVVVFACGGDGTIQEIANGLVGHENAVLGVVPIGSGNDFVRMLVDRDESTEKYLDLHKQIEGTPVKIDLLKMTYIKDNEEQSTYIVNGLNIGFDGYTAILAHDIKTIPGLGGELSYVAALVANLVKKKGETLRITADGEELHEGNLLLTTIANGGFCGGGFNSCPRADLSDGKAELLVVKNISRRSFVKLAPKYKKGGIHDIHNFDELCKYRSAKSFTIEPMAAPTMKFVADGEVFELGAIKVDVVDDALWVNRLP